MVVGVVYGLGFLGLLIVCGYDVVMILLIVLI